MSRTRLGWLIAVVGAALASSLALAQDAVKIEKGHEIFALWCEGCHARGTPVQSNPAGGSYSLVGRVWAGTYTLQQRYDGRLPAALEDRTDLSPDFIRTVVREGLNIMPGRRRARCTDRLFDAQQRRAPRVRTMP
jgi:mono/diheme cytochrome c family protein